MATTASTIVLRYLTGDFPAEHDRLVERAREQGADGEVLATVAQLPDRTYESPTDVRDALGGVGAGS